MLKIEILSPTAIFYKGEVDSVTFPGMEGSFTIYRRHAPIVALLVKGSLICKKDGKNTIFLIEKGIVEGKSDVIKVCVE